MRPLRDDWRWTPMQTAIETRQQQTRSIALAVTDLEEEMAGGKLRAMCRNLSTGERERLETTFWLDHQMDIPTGFGSVYVWRRTGERWADKVRRWGVIDRYPDKHVDGFAFFVWKPDLDKLAAARADHDGNSDMPAVRPGPKPRDNWPTLIARWLITVAAADPQRLQNVDTLVIDAQDLLRNRIKWAPSDKDLRAKIVELLQDIRH